MRVLTWHWGRRGAGPRFALGMREGVAALPGMVSLLSLSAQAELLAEGTPPACELAMPTYRGAAGLLGRVVSAPLAVAPLRRRLQALRPDVAVCAMASLLDPLMTQALGQLGIPYAVVVHDAACHPGDRRSLAVVGALQLHLLRGAARVITLSSHVAQRLAARGISADAVVTHPPFRFGPPTAAPRSHGGTLRLLFFGRLLPYKGLDLLAGALERVGPAAETRIVGSGPESAALRRLRAMESVRVENRWVPEAEIAGLLAWADAVVLPYREASQSGVAAAALAAGRFVVATDVGGLPEQLAGEQRALLCGASVDGLVAALRQLERASPRGWLPRPAESGWSELAAAVLPAVSRPLFPGAAASRRYGPAAIPG